jgi:hypothetical protein
MKQKGTTKFGAVALAVLVASAAGAAEEDRIQALEKQMAAMNEELSALKNERQDLSVLEEQSSKLRLGGYGEIHANFEESGKDKIDIHRLVMYMGYDFNDWIQLNSEVELEHAWTEDGYLLIEQLYADFLLSDPVNIRAGRVLAPLGIVNQKHEPPLFNGVERPNVEKYIIPSTWSLDGIGIFGSPLSWLSYEAYAVAGLDESGFNGKEGIRGGREKGRQGLNDGALTGRIDLFPCDKQDLRIGLSGYYGGTDGTGSTNNIDNTFGMVSSDFEYDISRLRLRGVAAWGKNSDAKALNDAYTPTDKDDKGYKGEIGEEIFGWYLEAGVSVLPESWKKGRLVESDLIPFVRYERYDTQYEMDEGTSDDGGKYDRTDITVGLNWLLTSDFVVKADVQFADTDEAGSDTKTKYNLGIGWILR